MPPRLAVALVEDDEVLREGLGALIKTTPGFHFAGAWRAGEDILRDLSASAPEVVLMDISLPGMSGTECVRELKRRRPALQVVMFTIHEEDAEIFRAIEAGATGYLVKRTPPAEILAALAEVHRGGAPMSSGIARKVLRAFQRLGAARRNLDGLTPREREILDHLARGYSYKEIAGALHIGIETVRTHLASVYRKLHVRSGTEAVAKYFGAK